MKKFAFATLAALAAVVASQQQAKAWFNLGVGASFNTNLSFGGLNVCRQAEPWPHNYGNPSFNYYGAAAGVPAYPVNPYGMTSYGCPPPPGMRPGLPVPPQGQGSGAPQSFNYVPRPMGYGDAMPYAQPAAYYFDPAIWYGR
jgi:hypothetical protein